MDTWPAARLGKVFKPTRSYLDIDIRLLTIWELRPDLQNIFDISSEEDFCGFLGWWFWKGQGQYPNLRVNISSQVRDCLLKPSKEVVQDVDFPITQMMKGLWKGFDGFWSDRYTLDSTDSRRAFCAHWYFTIYSESGGLLPEPDQTKANLQSSSLKDSGIESWLTKGYVLWWFYVSGEYLPTSKDRDTSKNYVAKWAYLNFWKPEQICPRSCWPEGKTQDDFFETFWAHQEIFSEQEKAILDIGKSIDHFKHKASGLQAFQNSQLYQSEEKPGKIKETLLEPLIELKKGVNLIGYAKGEIGIGEDVRCASSCLEQEGIDHSIFSYPRQTSFRQNAKSHDHRILDDNPFDINIFCLPAIESSWAAIELGEKFFKGRYNIGYWPWELSKWPSNLSTVFSYFDEVWAPSKFIEKAIKEVSPIPVFWMPLSLSDEVVADVKRVDYGLPESSFLFLFTFDFGSSFYRKNPMDIIFAFKEAFPLGTENVGLVFKYMNHNPENPNFKKFSELCKQDTRIKCFEGTMDKAKVLGLMKTADVFVSLHRAEGFGRCIAEAMLLSKPTVVTDFSGSTDFCKQEFSELVDYELQSIDKNEYWYSDGQTWAYPNIQSAALAMRRLFDNPHEAHSKGEKARQWVLKNHSHKAVGLRYKSRLDEIIKKIRT